MTRFTVVLLIVALSTAACEREKRDLHQSGIIPPAVPVVDLAPGGIHPAVNETSHFDENAYAISQGKTLFSSYNCSGCHANGGGDKGPALMDDVWIYGSDPANVYSTIVEGRPNGMPSFGGHIPDNEVWELVAYVRSLSGLASDSAAPNRADAMQVKKPESQTDKQTPVVAAPSGASERP